MVGKGFLLVRNGSLSESGANMRPEKDIFRRLFSVVFNCTWVFDRPSVFSLLFGLPLLEDPSLHNPVSLRLPIRMTPLRRTLPTQNGILK